MDLSMSERLGLHLAHMRSDFRFIGPIGSATYIIDRLLSKLSRGRIRLHHYIILQQPVPPSIWEPISREGRNLRTVMLEESDVDFTALPRPREVIQARFKQGARCVACYKGNDFVGYIWFNIGPYIEDEVRCRFVPEPRARASWDYDAYVVEQYRFGRPFKLLWDEVFQVLRQHGVGVTYSRIAASNVPSISSHVRMGANPIGTLLFLCVGPLQCTLGSLSPYLHISLSKKRMPVVRLKPSGSVAYSLPSHAE